MSAKSPRGPISGASSDEVAADFGDSLKDLQINNRYEITNLTIIAKENTEHAQAISRALENHIKTTPSSRKLPALYVLDSIVKNVGTPYTVYLGRNLYKIFMESYTLVDGPTRRNMEAMLKTWKEPVPGSIDPRPVFPQDTVRPIENALIKAKTAALQTQRQAQPNIAYRDTPTPPQHNGHLPPIPTPLGPSQFPGAEIHQSTPQPQYPFVPPPQQPPSEIEDIKREITALISRDQFAFASNMHDASLQRRLSALLDLQKILNLRNFTAAEIQAIRLQVSQLSASSAGPPTHQSPMPTAPTPHWTPPVSSHPHHPLQSSSTPLNQPPPQLAPPLMTPEALNGLQALLSNVAKPSTPQMRAAMPAFRDASHAQLNAIQNHAAAAPPANVGGDLLSSLAKAGLIKPTVSAPAPAAAIPANTPAMPDTTALLQSLKNILPPASHQGTPTQPPARSSSRTSHVPVSSTSLKTFRPELVFSLYDAQPNQCNACGRRFQATDEGRARKDRHLDWHFRTNQRIADPNSNRGHHRNWYVDEMEWIRHREYDPSTATGAVADGDPGAKAEVEKKPQDQFVRAPAGMTKNVCNICFEDMKSSYSENLQDWVFTNAAVAAGGRIVHATCLAEMGKAAPAARGAGAALAAPAGGNHARERSATPDSLLGKRKAESAMVGNASRARH